MADLADVCVVGLGRVGLPIALLAARAGHRVVGAERDVEMRSLARGERDSPEPGLRDLAISVRDSARLTVSEHISAARTVVVCVGTPLRGDCEADLSDLAAVVHQVDEIAPPDALVLIASTVPVGTTERIASQLRARAPARKVACCPERVLPGDLLKEMIESPRLAGGVDPVSTEAAAHWLSTIVSGPIERVDSRTAELAKLVENAARDVQLALAHTAAALAKRFGIDPHTLRTVVNHHPRVHLLVPGIGVGGHCLPVDPWFLVSAARAETALLRVAREINDRVPEHWIEEITSTVEALSLARPTIGLLGLSYKPDTDDVRQSPALAIARALSLRFDVYAHDPYLREIEGVRLAPLQVVLGCDLVALLVAHREYRGISGGEHCRVWLDCCGLAATP